MVGIPEMFIFIIFSWCCKTASSCVSKPGWLARKISGGLWKYLLSAKKKKINSLICSFIQFMCWTLLLCPGDKIVTRGPWCFCIPGQAPRYSILEVLLMASLSGSFGWVNIGCIAEGWVWSLQTSLGDELQGPTGVKWMLCLSLVLKVENILELVHKFSFDQINETYFLSNKHEWYNYSTKWILPWKGLTACWGGRTKFLLLSPVRGNVLGNSALLNCMTLARRC